MKTSKTIIQSKSYAIGYEQGKKQALEQILKFVEEESKFIPNVHSDTLLDRLVKEVKKIEDK